MVGVSLAVLGLGVLTTAAKGPGYGDVLPDLPVATASLSFSGVDPIITGSVEHIFEGQGFTGPNRTAKQDRQRINVDVAAFSQGFEDTRMQIAASRGPSKGDVPPAMLVASLAPAGQSSALAAIQNFAPDQSVPMPVAASDQLAYARANAPISTTTTSAAKYSEKELWCMATAIYFEARGESYRGQVAVAQVVMNRLQHKLYPDTICGVVFQNQTKRNACQFSFACDGQSEVINDKKSWTQAEEIALKVSNGELYLAEVGNATHYHATYVYPGWANKMTKMTKVGLHVFYRFKRGWRFG